MWNTTVIFVQQETEGPNVKMLWKDPATLQYGTEYNYTFTDPSAYVGPVLRGWTPEKSRDTNVYIRPNENTILTGESETKSGEVPICISMLLSLQT